MFDKREYYNQDSFWNVDLYEKEKDKERIDIIINNIPDDVESLLDVGCGNNAFINKLLKQNKKNCWSKF